MSSYHDIESDMTEVSVYLEDSGRAVEAKKSLDDALSIVGADARSVIGEIADEDWKFAYRRHFKTEKVSPRVYTHPPWESVPATADGEIVITLDPGLAFGTGKHETTKACLQYIDEISAPLSTQHSALSTFLDMGCGSGILSIAAAKLGFGAVSAFDIDEDAVAATLENAAANGVTVDARLFALGKGAVTLDSSIEAAKGLYPDLALQGRAVPESAGSVSFPVPSDVVVANILGPLLIAFADEIAPYAKRELVISGILNELYPEVLAAYAARGFREVSRKTIGEWTTGRLTRI